MTREDVKAIVMDDLMALYAKPFGVGDDTAALKAYIEDLADIPAYALDKGWKEIRRSHAQTVRPNIAEIRKACLSHVQATATYRHPPSQRECFATPQGQYALSKGHGNSFYNTCWQRKEIISQKATEVMISEILASRNSMATDPDQRIRDAGKRNIATTEKAEAELRRKYGRAAA